MTNATLVAKTSLRTTIARQSQATMMEQNPAQKSGDSERDEENFHVATSKIPRKKRKVGVVQRDFRNEKPSHSTKHVTHSLLQDELNEDTTREEIADDVTNLFAFK